MIGARNAICLRADNLRAPRALIFVAEIEKAVEGGSGSKAEEDFHVIRPKSILESGEKGKGCALVSDTSAVFSCGGDGGGGTYGMRR